jgi:hypothetical protein
MKIETWLDHEIRFIEIDGEWRAVAKDEQTQNNGDPFQQIGKPIDIDAEDDLPF